MADTYTPNLRLRKPQIGAYTNAWDVPLNEVAAVVEQSIAGAISVSVTAGNVTLTTANGSDDQARRMHVYATGTPAAARTITVPDTPKLYVLINDSTKTVTFTRASGGTTLAVIPGQSCLAFVTTAGIFEVPPSGAFVADGAMTALTLDIGGAHGAGDATTTMKYVVQGSFVFVRLLGCVPLNFSNTAFTLDRTGGIDWPAEMVPARQQIFPIHAQENGALVAANLVVSTAGATPWSILKADGTAWLGTGPDDRSLPALSFTYSLRNF